MCSAKTIRVGFATTAVLLIGLASIATAQSYSYLWDNGNGNNNWGTGPNWGLNPPLNLGVNNVTPNAFFEEQGLINNGNTVNVTTSQTQFSGTAADNAAAAAGVTVDGVTATGQRFDAQYRQHRQLEFVDDVRTERRAAQPHSDCGHRQRDAEQSRVPSPFSRAERSLLVATSSSTAAR